MPAPSYLYLLLPGYYLDNPSARQIARRQLDNDPVANEQPDEIPLERAADMGRYAAAFNVDPIQAARQLRFDHTLDNLSRLRHGVRFGPQCA